MFQMRQLRPTPGLGHVEGKVPKGLKNYDEEENKWDPKDLKNR